MPEPMRYQLRSGPSVGATLRYAIWDNHDKVLVSTAPSKEELIKQVQELNELEADGDPVTWRAQLEASGDR